MPRPKFLENDEKLNKKIFYLKQRHKKTEPQDLLKMVL